MHGTRGPQHVRRTTVGLGGRRGDKGGASVGQRGGAEALRSTAPPWLPVQTAKGYSNETSVKVREA